MSEMGEFTSVLRKESSSTAICGEDQFYEEIEAPKFVDFTIRDRSRPDDSSWFCARIGCDQNHEDVDPDALYKSFVLRVMAARSPNVRLRKALIGQASNTISKCPHSAPAKSAKGRTKKLSVIASISEKICNPKLKVHPISSLRTTSYHAKATKQPPIVEKALTTPRRKKCPPNKELFRSVRNSKAQATVPKNKMVAKALVFHTPMKAEKTIPNSRRPVSEICDGVNKLDIGGRTRQVSRHLHSSMSVPASASSKSRAVNRKPLSGVRDASVDQEVSKIEAGPSNGSSDMEINGKTGNGGSVSKEVVSSKVNLQPLEEDYVGYSDSNSSSKAEGKDSGETDIVFRTSDPTGDEKSEKETVENSSDVDDNKENSSATYNNRDLNSNTIYPGENSQHKTCEHLRKVASKNFQERPARGGKYKRMKPTNPKPFRLRTDERGILKEANLERRLQLDAQKESTSVPRHRDEIQGRARPAPAKSARSAEPETVASIPQRRKQLEDLKKKEKPQNKILKLTPLQQLVKPPSNVAASGKALTSLLGVGKETQMATMRPKEAASCESEVENNTTAMSSWVKRPTTIPKEPFFHRIHLPKSCTKRTEKATS